MRGGRVRKNAGCPAPTSKEKEKRRGKSEKNEEGRETTHDRNLASQLRTTIDHALHTVGDGKATKK